MNRLKKLVFIGILCFSIIFSSPFIFIFLSGTTLEHKFDKGEVGLSKLEALGIRLTFIHNFNDSIVISWFTEENAKDPKIIYSIKADFSDSKEIKANLTAFSVFVYFYAAELTNLKPNTTYYYQVNLDDNNKREIMSFTTMANNNTNNIRFLTYGDSRTGKLVRRVLSNKIMEFFKDSFDFIIHAGDIVEEGENQKKWNNYFKDTENLNAYKQGIYVEGNHEEGLRTKMYNNLLMPNTEVNRYYSFSYGSIGFIILNSNDYTIGDDVQTEWLNETLIHYSQENLFNFVFLHHPLLHSRSYEYHRENWRPLFEKYNISLVISGHNHHYERSYPSFNSTNNEYDKSELYNYTNLKNPIYIVSGGAGAPLYSLYNYDFIAKNIKSYHFLIIDINKEVTKTTLSLEAWGMREDFGNLYLFDNITITKWKA